MNRPESASGAMRPGRSFLFCMIVILLGLFGAVQLAGGIYLVALGGSLYYAVAGIMLVATAVLIWRHQRRGVALYTVYLLATLVWAFWEVGAHFWLLMPRVVLPLLFGALLATPSIRRRLSGHPVSGERALALSFVSVGTAIVVGLALHGMNPSPPDPVYQTGIAAPGDIKAVTFTGPQGAAGDWPVWGGDKAGNRFSTLDQITPENVGQLELAWTYRTGFDPDVSYAITLAVTPLKVGRTLYVCRSGNDLAAVDAETGEEIWRFDAHTNMHLIPTSTCRGIAYFKGSDGDEACAERIIANTVDARLLAVDAHTGQPCQDFGQNGEVSLLKGMGDFVNGYYAVTSPPTIVRGKIVVGGWVTDGQYWGEPSGVIRAFDAVTGQFAWAFDVGRLDRQSEPPEGETYTPATPNAWAPMSADEDLGLVYAPTGNSTPDYYGAQRRPFDEKYSGSVIAIDAETGKLRWSFQTTHHDIWDYDVGSQPVLVDLQIGDQRRHALIQPTKRGEIFVLDRATGEPLTEVTERPAPQDGKAPEEWLAPTQPYSPDLPSFRGADLTEADMWGLTPLDQLWCRIRFKEARYDGPMTPPGPTPAIFFPNYIGGMNWGSVAVDRDRNVMIVNASRIANRMRLIPRIEADAMGLHPLDENHLSSVGGTVPQRGVPYGAEVGPFMSPLFIPCNAPPFGRIGAVDLSSGKLLWVRPHGTARGSGPLGIRSRLPFEMGTPTMGGSVTTRSGLTFIAASPDGLFRAIDSLTGETLWTATLPTGAMATPMTYVSPESGRQFVVIAAGGHAALGSPRGDYIVAFALPKTGHNDAE